MSSLRKPYNIVEIAHQLKKRGEVVATIEISMHALTILFDDNMIGEYELLEIRDEIAARIIGPELLYDDLYAIKIHECGNNSIIEVHIIPRI